ncbi:DUF4134 domain-containing protein [Chondrinema litorale]|uniref:DUF4134 domain-containing protein n=1 Tax=Chondrinema litorale TaxID=2994555 RepID=UPI002542BEF1|nr:DUF4134 domain-containing protein [Chondrinema litorale]UZR99621.1 DUF4134 domain-containing protein [Chondrinema litorale]
MKKIQSIIFLSVFYGSNNLLWAQGATGITTATTELKTYIDPVASLILIIGAVVGLIGGVRVYIKWNSGDQDVQKSIMGWFGSCLFLVLVGTVIKAFFSV